MGHKINKYFKMDYKNMTCETIRSKPLAQDCAGRGDFVGTAINF
jgi:hypothetical protein